MVSGRRIALSFRLIFGPRLLLDFILRFSLFAGRSLTTYIGLESVQSFPNHPRSILNLLQHAFSNSHRYLGFPRCRSARSWDNMHRVL